MKDLMVLGRKHLAAQIEVAKRSRGHPSNPLWQDRGTVLRCALVLSGRTYRMSNPSLRTVTTCSS